MSDGGPGAGAGACAMAARPARRPRRPRPAPAPGSGGPPGASGRPPTVTGRSAPGGASRARGPPGPPAQEALRGAQRRGWRQVYLDAIFQDAPRGGAGGRDRRAASNSTTKDRSGAEIRPDARAGGREAEGVQRPCRRQRSALTSCALLYLAPRQQPQFYAIVHVLQCNTRTCIAF